MKVTPLLLAAACLSVAGLAQSSGSAGAQGNASQRTDRAVSSSAQGSAGMNAQANAGGASAGLSADTTIDAELTKPVDARKAKPGDEVTARVRNDVRRDGNLVLRRGTKLIGHVTQAQAKANGQANSELGIIFDRAEVKGGQSLSLQAAIQALAPAAHASNDDAAMSDVGTSPSVNPAGGGGGMGSGPGAGGALGGVGNTVGGATREAGSAVGGVAQGAGRRAGMAGGAAGSLSSSSRGVVGLPGVQMSSELSNTTNGTVLVSNGKDIRLDSGTQMVLRVMTQSGTQQP